MIDLRSDTVTQPTKDMLDFMSQAKVGDDVLGDDPTVIACQEEVADLFGKEAGLFVPSGTMSNQIALRIHCQPGTEIICDVGSHIYNYEGGAASALSGIQIRPQDDGFGVLNPESVKKNIRVEGNIHFAQTALIEIENTHNRGGGTITPLDNIQKLRSLADENHLPLHLDGARIWNASVRTGVSFKEYGKYFDTISVCFSKGLGAPVGSMLLGSKKALQIGYRYRKLFGGGMRQSGYLAAAAQFAVRNNIDRLYEDHQNASLFAGEINTLEGFSVNLSTVHTNIVMVDIDNPDINAADIVESLAELGLGVLAVNSSRIRAVFHLHITEEDTRKAVDIFSRVLSN